jgi:ammonium transporter, Amt family
VACSAGLAALFYSYIRSKKFDLGLIVNGFLGGLVAITCPCYWVDPIGAFFIGIVAAIVVVWGLDLLEYLRIDDPIGAVPVHLVAGIWGTLQYGSNKENYQQKYSKTRGRRRKKLKHVRSYHRRMDVFFEPFLLRLFLFEPYWGTLALGLFATGAYGAPTATGASTTSVVTGLFYGGGVTQLGLQALGSFSTVIATLGISLLMMFGLKWIGVLRVSNSI